MSFKRVTKVKSVLFPKMKKLGKVINSLLTWNPGYLVTPFWNSKAKSLYGDFLFINYESQFITVLMVNIVVHISLRIIMSSLTLLSGWMSWLSTATTIASVLFHVALTGLLLWKKSLIRKVHYIGAFLSLSLFNFAIEEDFCSLRSSQLFLISSFIMFLSITIFFQNSTLLIVILFLIQLGIVMVGYYHCKILPLNFPVTIVSSAYACTSFILLLWYAIRIRTAL